jgi:aspartate-semialdehyde dehydrogenase
VTGLRVAIVGATGLVGEMLGQVLAERRFPIGALRAYATARGAGSVFRCGTMDVRVQAIDESGGDLDTLGDVDVAFLAAGESIAKSYARGLAARGVLVIDKSSLFRLEPDVPLVVPEVNAVVALGGTLVANPNCSTIPLAMVLAAVDREFGLTWASVATYQSVSGAGKDAIAELRAQSEGSETASALPRRIAGNVVPQIGSFDGAGNTTEETKVCAELRKILDRPALPVSATAVRVPVEVGHSAALAFATAKPAAREQIARALASAPGITFVDDERYATPIDIAGSDAVSVTRLRPDGAHPDAWLSWVVCDNLRKGAATNAVQIAETVLELAKVPA